MCKEDVRIKRKTESASKLVPNSLAVGSTLFKAQGDRVALILAITQFEDPALGSVIAIGIRSGAGNIALASVSMGAPTAVLTIEQIGMVITQEIIVVSVSNSSMIASATAVKFTEDLREL